MDVHILNCRARSKGTDLQDRECIVIYKTVFVINIIIYMYLQHSNVLCI